MPDSSITKRALASALKELMLTEPFARIKIDDICRKCNMSRKSFYYHFRDKFDLVNWIYDTEFSQIRLEGEFDSDWTLLMDMCTYFYENRAFYRKAFKIQGQNSFKDHFQEVLTAAVALLIEGILPSAQLQAFIARFYTRAIVMAIQDWILDDDSVPPDEFMNMLQSCLKVVAQIYNEDQ